MTDRMQARRDAFLMLTDEKPPAEPKRWLVVWDDESGAFNWSHFDVLFQAESKCGHLAGDGLSHRMHDLDDQ